MNVTQYESSTSYQITNYGLAGSVMGHMDFYGYEKGMELDEERKSLVYS